MRPSLRDSKWLIVAVCLLCGFIGVVLTVAKIEARFHFSERGSPRSKASSKQGGPSMLSERSDDPAALEEDEREAILESDSIEERIRKTYGLVRRNGIWLPAYPLSAEGARLAALGTAVSDHETQELFVLPLYITTGGLPVGRVGQPYQTKIAAVGGVPPYSWTIERNPDELKLSLNRLNGELTGDGGVAGAKTFRVRVTDAVGAADVAEFKWRVAGLEEPVLAEGPLSAAVGAVNGESANPSVRNAAGDGPLPTTISSEGSSEGSNVANVVTAPADVETAKPKDPLMLLPLVLEEAVRGQAYTAQFSASGGEGSYLWSFTGVLPVGMTLSAAGLLSGTPTEHGSFRLVIGVSDGVAAVSQNLDLVVNPAPLGVVAEFSAFVSLQKIALAWTNPADSNLASIRIVRQTERPPVNESDGFMVYEGIGQSFIDPVLPPGAYYYAAFSIGLEGDVSEPVHVSVVLRSDAKPFADQLVDARLLHPQAYNATLLPNIVLGGPRGNGIRSGSLDVVSIGAGSVDAPGGAPYGGSIVLGFSSYLIFDGPGHDFTVSENVFYVKGPTGYDPNSRFMEPAVVSVSQDGNTWYTFPFDFSPRYDPVTGAPNLRHPYTYNRGFAGVNPVISNGSNVDPTDSTVSGGDSFDLAELGVPGLTWVRYVRLQATGHKWLVDVDGELVHHINDSSRAADRTLNSAGFDLDAVTSIWFDSATNSR